MASGLDLIALYKIMPIKDIFLRLVRKSNLNRLVDHVLVMCNHHVIEFEIRFDSYEYIRIRNESNFKDSYSIRFDLITALDNAEGR